MGEKFREFSLESLESFAFVVYAFASHTHALRCMCVCLVVLISLYKLSWKWLSSITKMGEIVRAHLSMCGFGNWWQSLWTNGCLELYSKDLSVGTSWSPSVGFKEFIWWPRWYSRFIQRLVMWELSLLQACLEEEDCVSIHVYLQDIIFMKREDKIQGWSRLSQKVNQVDQHTKRTRCTERDQVIPWYGKHCPLRFVY